MGKGDKKSRKGKITMGSHGVTRPSKKNKAKAASVKKAAAPKKAATPKKTTEKKAVAPKKAAKKAE
jgi:30S ribosomal protein S31